MRRRSKRLAAFCSRTLTALAVVEHWFLVLPIDGNALWRAFRRRPGASGLDAVRRVELELASIRNAVPAQQRVSAVELHLTHLSHSWSADPPAVCDARIVEQVLERIAAGSFGEVDCVHGLVRTKADWVCFELTGGRPRMAAFAPKRRHKPLVVAKGRQFDRVGLQAAFEGCAALV